MSAVGQSDLVLGPYPGPCVRDLAIEVILVKVFQLPYFFGVMRCCRQSDSEIAQGDEGGEIYIIIRSPPLRQRNGKLKRCRRRCRQCCEREESTQVVLDDHLGFMKRW